MHIRHGKPAPLELLRWEMAEQYGWSLEYIDALSLADIHERAQVEHGKGKAAENGRR